MEIASNVTITIGQINKMAIDEIKWKFYSWKENSNKTVFPMEENPAQMTSSSLMSNALLLFLLLSVPLIIVAITLNGLAFLVFYKKPVFRKILANR